MFWSAIIYYMTYREPIVTEDQLIKFCCALDTIIQAINAGKYVCAAFLDLRKAFDSLYHHLLLDRLHDLGISGIELQ